MYMYMSLSLYMYVYIYIYIHIELYRAIWLYRPARAKPQITVLAPAGVAAHVQSAPAPRLG